MPIPGGTKSSDWPILFNGIQGKQIGDRAGEYWIYQILTTGFVFIWIMLTGIMVLLDAM